MAAESSGTYALATARASAESSLGSARGPCCCPAQPRCASTAHASSASCPASGNDVTKIAEAVTIADGVCRASNYKDHATLATLAAAYAEAGRFADAVRTNERAMEIAGEKGQGRIVEQLRERHAGLLTAR